jgi:hypothetical protein
MTHAKNVLKDNDSVNGNISVKPYLTVDNKEVDPDCLKVEFTASEINIQLTAPKKGTYSFGLAFEAQKIMPLAAPMAFYSKPEFKGKAVVRYPYDWTYRVRDNFILEKRPRLVMPGLAVDGKVFIADTRELYSVQIDTAESKMVRALLLKHKIYNDGEDLATVQLKLDKGQKETFKILLFKDVKSAAIARCGTTEPMKGSMVQITYRNWPAKAFDKKQYQLCSDKFKGIFDYTIIREIEIPDWIPPIFHKNNIKVHCYQYIGALRRRSTQVNDELVNDMGLKDKNGHFFTCPTIPEGSWQLFDIRRPEVRDMFVKRACQAIEAGYDGIFLDGSAVWGDSLGQRGGDVPNAKHSLAYARWQVVRQITQAVHKINPNAKVGVLANTYYDTLGECDYVMREKMYMDWDRREGYGKYYFDRRTQLSQIRDLDYEFRETPYITKNIIYGSKGYSPVSVQSAVNFLRKPTGFIYYDLGDFFPNQLEQWIDDLIAIGTQSDVYITNIDPEDCLVHFEEKNIIKVDVPCTVDFSKEVSLMRDEDKSTKITAKSFDLAPEHKYELVK